MKNLINFSKKGRLLEIDLFLDRMEYIEAFNIIHKKSNQKM
jgi:hypothetical protein